MMQERATLKGYRIDFYEVFCRFLEDDANKLDGLRHRQTILNLGPNFHPRLKAGVAVLRRVEPLPKSHSPLKRTQFLLAAVMVN